MSITQAINDLATILNGGAPSTAVDGELYERLVIALERMAACSCNTTVTPISGGCFALRDKEGNEIYNFGQEFVLVDPDDYRPDDTKWGVLTFQGTGQGLPIWLRVFVASGGAEFGSCDFVYTDRNGTETETVDIGNTAEVQFTPPAGGKFTMLIRPNGSHSSTVVIENLSLCQDQTPTAGGVEVGSGLVQGVSVGKPPKPPSPTTPLTDLFYEFALTAIAGRRGTLSASFTLPPAVTWIPGDVGDFITHISGVTFWRTPWVEVGIVDDRFVIQAEIENAGLTGMLGRFFIPLTKFTYSSLADVGLISVVVDFEEE